MCLIQRQVCISCRYRDVELDEDESKTDQQENYVIDQCKNLTDIIADLKKTTGWTPDEQANLCGRFHCPDIQWPPTSVATCSFVCEQCLSSYYYEWCDIVTGTMDSDTPDSDSDTDTDESDDGQKHRLLEFAESKLPQEPARLLCRDIENKFGLPDGEQGKFALEGIWFVRAKEAAHRYLTVLIPKCNLCDELLVHERENLKRADVIRGRHAGQDDEANAEETNDEEIDNIWAADVEFEPNSILWKWLALLHQNKTDDSVEGQTDILLESVETHVKTGFVSKPCATCVEKEFQCRKQVCQFVQGDVANSQAWMVFNWLMTRGCGNVPMFDHAAISFGYPNTEPPTYKEMMSLMAATWKRMTGVAWHEVDSIEPPSYSPLPCSLPITMHEKPLVKLSQLPAWRRMLPLERRHILPGLQDNQVAERNEVDDVEAVEKDHSPRVSAFVRSRDPGRSLIVTFKTASRREKKPKKFVQSSRVLKKLKRSPSHMKTMQIESGLSAAAMDKALSALIGVLSDGDDLPLPGSFQLRDSQRNAAHVGEENNTGASLSAHGQRQATPRNRSVPNPPTPITEDEQSPAKQVHFQNFENVERGEDSFGDDLDEDWEQMDDDVAMQDGGDEVLELGENEIAAKECDLGHTHLMEAKEGCDGLTATGGTLFFLPIGWSSVDENDKSLDRETGP